MNNPWLKILVFGLLFGIGGFLIGRCCGNGCSDKGGCNKEMSCCKDGMCKHGGDCCKEGGKCSMEGCDHAAMMGGCDHGKKACCKGEGHGKGHGEGHGDHMSHAGDEQAETIIQGLKDSNFQGDTTIKIQGGTVHVSRTADKMEVKVEMSDSLKVEEKTVEHVHH